MRRAVLVVACLGSPWASAACGDDAGGNAADGDGGSTAGGSSDGDGTGSDTGDTPGGSGGGDGSGGTTGGPSSGVGTGGGTTTTTTTTGTSGASTDGGGTGSTSSATGTGTSTASSATDGGTTTTTTSTGEDPSPLCINYCACMAMHCADVPGYPMWSTSECHAFCGDLDAQRSDCWFDFCIEASLENDPADRQHACEHAWGLHDLLEC